MKKTVSVVVSLFVLLSAGVTSAAKPASPLTTADLDTCGALVSRLFESGATYLPTTATPAPAVQMKNGYMYTATKNAVSVVYISPDMFPAVVGTVRCDQSVKKQLASWSWPAPLVSGGGKK